eukprot:6179942-Pleurochrysis_carterae.AAC.1
MAPRRCRCSSAARAIATCFSFDSAIGAVSLELLQYEPREFVAVEAVATKLHVHNLAHTRASTRASADAVGNVVVIQLVVVLEQFLRTEKQPGNTRSTISSAGGRESRHDFMVH